MAMISVRWADHNLKLFGDRIERLKNEFPKVLPRIVNQVGDRAKTQVIRTLAKQTGLPLKTIRMAIGDPSRATSGRMSYEMITAGGNIRLKYLRARETPSGVVARPFGKSTLYPGAFMKGGRFPDRKTVAQFDGHAFFRNGSGRHIAFARSGVFIPVEMTSGATRTAFLKIAEPLLKERVEAAIEKLLP